MQRGGNNREAIREAIGKAGKYSRGEQESEQRTSHGDGRSGEGERRRNERLRAGGELKGNLEKERA